MAGRNHQKCNTEIGLNVTHSNKQVGLSKKDAKKLAEKERYRYNTKSHHIRELRADIARYQGLYDKAVKVIIQQSKQIEKLEARLLEIYSQVEKP